LARGHLDYRDCPVSQKALNVVADIPGLGLGDYPPHIDLITYVHGLHDVGDKFGLVARAASRLVEDGWFAGGHPEPGGVGGDERPGARAVS
jgi:hypothetical protein